MPPAQPNTSGLSADQIQDALNAGDAILEEILRDENMLQAFSERWREILHAEASAIFLVRSADQGARFLTLVSESNANGFRTQMKVILPVRSVHGGGLTPHLAHEGKIVALSGKELTENPYLSRAGSSQAGFLTNRTSYSLLGFPLKNRKGQLLGFVKAQNKLDQGNTVDMDGSFSETDIVLASIMATRLVGAIESKNLLRSVGDILRARPDDDLDSYLNAILPPTLQIVGADRGSVSLWQDEPEPAGLYVRAAQIGDGERGRGFRIPERSVISTVWKEGKTILIPDVSRFKGDYFEANSGTRSEIAVLLAARSLNGTMHPLGVLNAEASVLNGFDAQDQMVLEALALDMSSGIDLANQDAAHRKLLRRCTSEIVRSVDQILDEVLGSLQSTFAFDGGVIYVADHSRHVLTLRATLGRHKPSGYDHDFEKQSLAGYIYRTAEAVFVPDPKNDPRVWLQGLEQFSVVGPMLGLPLTHSGRVVGVLLVWSTRPTYYPRDEHRHRLYPFACVAAAQIAVGHAYWLLDTAMHQLSNPANTMMEACRRQYFDVLAGETAKLEAIVRRTRELRRFRRTPPEKEAFSLSALVLEYSRRGNSLGNIEVVTDIGTIGTNSSCIWFGDRTRIGIAIDELFSNAIKHSEPGAKVIIRLSEDSVSYVIDVIDEGPGVSEKLTQAIWVPYNSFGSRKGSGLGLAIARVNVAEHDGTISEHGGTMRMLPGQEKVAVFTVTLPKGTP